MTQWEMKCRYSVQTKKCSQLKKPILLAINLSLLSLNFMSLVMLRKNETLIMRDDLRHRGKYCCRDMPCHLRLRTFDFFVVLTVSLAKIDISPETLSMLLFAEELWQLRTLRNCNEMAV